jgi:hypothetical protein
MPYALHLHLHLHLLLRTTAPMPCIYTRCLAVVARARSLTYHIFSQFSCLAGWWLVAGGWISRSMCMASSADWIWISRRAASPQHRNPTQCIALQFPTSHTPDTRHPYPHATRRRAAGVRNGAARPWPRPWQLMELGGGTFWGWPGPPPPPPCSRNWPSPRSLRQTPLIAPVIGKRKLPA